MSTPVYSGPNLETTHPGAVLDAVELAAHYPKDPVLHGGDFRYRIAVRAVQRLMDLIAAPVLLMLLFPIFLTIAVLIWIDSPGPVLFIQKRVGKDGREFSFYKFRSMVRNAESLRASLEALNERDGPVFKMKNDPRVTRIGRFIRKYSLDELPQLFNVVIGDMSLIGPRPALPKEVAQYTPRQAQRLAVTPGVTGLWQVSGRSEMSFEDSVKLDLYYIQNQSLLLNLRILLMTIPAVLRADGAC
jgi:exopolysaccharide biosynthesis polyprenyl glycosylphosphotransferase